MFEGLIGRLQFLELSILRIEGVLVGIGVHKGFPLGTQLYQQVSSVLELEDISSVVAVGSARCISRGGNSGFKG